MELAVHLPSLAEVPGMYDRLSEDAANCRKYAQEHFEFAFGPGLINRLNDRHERARDATLAFFGSLERFAGKQSQYISKCVEYYRTADAVAAAHLDSLLPTTPIKPEERRSTALHLDWDQARLLETCEPTEALKATPDYSRENPYKPTWSDAVSPGNVARDAIWGATKIGAKLGVCDRAYDPLDDMSLPLTGNWAGMHACADALTNLAEATRLIKANIDWITLRIQAVWLGNAADMYWRAASDLSKRIDGTEGAFAKLSSHYGSVVGAMREVEEPVEGLVVDLIDAAAFLVAAIATAPTGVGAVVFGGAAVVDIVRAAKKANDILSYISKAKTAGSVYNKGVGSVVLSGDIPKLPEIEIK